MNVQEILVEPLVIHQIGTPQERTAKARELLDTVGLPYDSLGRFPSDFSGGNSSVSASQEPSCWNRDDHL